MEDLFRKAAKEAAKMACKALEENWKQILAVSQVGFLEKVED